MKKLLLFLLLLIPINVFAVELPETYSQKIMIYDLTDDKVLLSKNAEEVSDIASITKLMTVLVAIENVNDIRSEITITQEMLNGIPWDAAKMGLQVGDIVTVEDMLYAAMLPSAADATHVIAHYVAGSTDAYVDLMNKKASALGMNDTHYQNVIGMDHETHKSSIVDIVTLLKYGLKNPEFKKIYTGKKHTMLNGVEVRSTVHIMQNVLQRSTERIIGAKTGYTDDAGTCIAAYFKSGGHEMLVITLKAPFVTGASFNIRDALDLIEFVDKNYGEQVILEKDTLIDTVKVKLATTTEYHIKATKDITKFLSNDYDKSKVSYEYTGATEILYNFKKGDELGKISYYYDGELVTNEYIVLNEELSPDLGAIFDTYKDKIFILGLASLFGIFVILIILKKSLA